LIKQAVLIISKFDIKFGFSNYVLFKIKSPSKDNERRELAINGLPSAVVKYGNIIRAKDQSKRLEQKIGAKTSHL
jgi:hypothetical protein